MAEWHEVKAAAPIESLKLAASARSGLHHRPPLVFEEGDDLADIEAEPSLAGACNAAARPDPLHATPVAGRALVHASFPGGSGIRLAWPLRRSIQVNRSLSHCKDRLFKNSIGPEGRVGATGGHLDFRRDPICF
jgi:hypothetical protein